MGDADYRRLPLGRDVLMRLFSKRKVGTHPAPSRLIWGYRMPHLDSICVIATATREPEGQDTLRRDFMPDAWDSGCDVVSYFRHWALLDGAIRVQVFNDGNGYCEGIIFDYADGSQQAVECCRTCVIVPVITLMPAWIHVGRKFGSSKHQSPWRTDGCLYTVAFSSNGDTVSNKETATTRVESFEMVGFLGFHSEASGTVTQACVTIKSDPAARI